MSPFQNAIDLMKQYRLPTNAEIRLRVRNWWQSDSKWFGISVLGHLLVLLIIAFIPMSKDIISQQEAPEFTSASIDTVDKNAEFTDFNLGETSLDTTELTTETLLVIDEAPIDSNLDVSAEPTPTFGNRDTSEGVSEGIGDAASVSDVITRQNINGPRSAQGEPGSDGSPTIPGSRRSFNPFGSRSEVGRTRTLTTGATKGTENAVKGALVWLARHQNSDGSWSLHRHECQDGRCSCNGTGEVQSDAAATAFALLPFLAAGQTHLSSGPHKNTVARGLDWLMSHQKQNGDLSAGAAQTMYTHGLASIVMCEAWGMSTDKRVGRSAQAALNFIQAAQSRSTGSWVYQPDPNATSGDTSVFGWQLMALKSGQMAGLQVDDRSLEGSRKWLKTVSKGNAGGLYCYNAATGPTPTMTAVGLLATQYLGAQRNDPRIVEGMNYFMTLLPNPKSRNCYYWYYATQVMHNLPGPEWDRWNREMRRVLIESQIKEGCGMGSWDPNLPTPDPWGKHGGRIMVTSIAALTLEVYYRYLPLYKMEPEDTVKRSTAKME